MALDSRIIDEYGARSEELARYMVETGATVRAAAAHFGISKSTVHKDVTQVLSKKNRTLYREVKKVLDLNRSERHLRGGEATKRKYLEKRADTAGKND